MRNVVLFSLPFLLICFQLCLATNTLHFGNNISQDNSNNLVSLERKFRLGFFSLPIESGSNTENLKKYLGIWYHDLEPQTVVWVANRNNPIVDSKGVFQIAKDGNMVVADASQSYWSTNLEASSSRKRVVKLLDSGNLVLMDDDHGYLWQSFQHPTDTFLPGMKMDINLALSSWKNENDPGIGSFAFQKAQTGDPRSYRVNNQSQLYWAFDGHNSDKMFNIILDLLENSTSNSLHKYRDITIKQRSFNYDKSRLLMNSTGDIQFWRWYDIQWMNEWSRPSDVCDRHNYCGSFSSCNKNNWIPCKCLPGFRRRLSDNDHGYLGERYQGCVRKSSKQCVTAATDNNMIFIKLTNIKVGNPDQGFSSETKADCQSLCLNKCSCNAYSYKATYNDRSYFSCWIWTRQLPTLQEEQDDGRDFSILVNSSDIGNLYLLNLYFKEEYYLLLSPFNFFDLFIIYH
ncbi:putative non-specific serine/threonine protein kinase [Medicago truncatula]|uniref:non-specific serine/threonine protein kinase n=1 Tax=Medicago truncatula TaxID=3880 RepID=A0A396JBT7_MEDTR|nr:putative non-specific serine/threonine protein kinase [Medicago truncatula]